MKKCLPILLAIVLAGCTAAPTPIPAASSIYTPAASPTSTLTPTLTPAPQVIVYPDPGDLSEVEGLTRSTAFSVTVNDMPAFVYQAGQGWSFFNFAFANTEVRVDVTVNETIDDWQVRPVSYNIKPIRSGSTFTFSLAKPVKMVLQINGRNGEKLLISAEPPEIEIPDPKDPSVLYYGPGVHYMGPQFYPPVGVDTVYVAGGAVVRGNLSILAGPMNMDRPKMSVVGPGIFAQGEFLQGASAEERLRQGINILFVPDILIDGITVVDSPGSPLLVGGQTATIRNVKVLSTRPIYNTDSSFSDVTRFSMTDFFVLSTDDGLSVNAPIRTAEFRNGILWNDNNGASFMLSGRGGSIRDILFEDIDVLENSSEFVGGTGVFSIKWGGVRREKITGVTFRNIRVENAVRPNGSRTEMFIMRIHHEPMWNEGFLGRVEDTRFENVTFPFGGGEIVGSSKLDEFQGVQFVNCTVGGEPLIDASQLGISTEFVTDLQVTFGPQESQPAAAPTTAGTALP